MILSLSEIKAQLRIEEDFTEEDALLTLLGGAAEARTSNYLNPKGAQAGLRTAFGRFLLRLVSHHIDR
ncbi:head-tail connector protein [Cronobacter malonaticus]